MQCVSDVGAELSFVLPYAELKAFPRLFETLDVRMSRIGITSYGVSVTTLEDVFLKVHFATIMNSASWVWTVCNSLHTPFSGSTD